MNMYYIFLYFWMFRAHLKIHTSLLTHTSTHTQSLFPSMSVTHKTLHPYTHTHNLVIFYDIPGLHYLHTLTNLSDVKNYTFIHLNNSDYFKSCALTQSLFFQMERELFTSNRIWINPINPFKVPWDKPIKYPQRWLTGPIKISIHTCSLFLFKRHQIANRIAAYLWGSICLR